MILLSVLKNKIIELTKAERIYLIGSLLIYCIYSCYHIFKYPVYIDEASSFVYYTSKGIFECLTSYNEPNNHIFLSLINSIIVKLPFDPLILARVPNLIIGIIFTIVFYLFCKKYYGSKIAMIMNTLLTFSYYFTFYSVFARGYMIIMFATLICYICITNFHKQNQSVFIISSIIGFYTIPVFLYVSVSFFIYLLITDYKNKVSIIKSYTIIGLVTFILYIPIIYYNGLDAIINNKWTKKVTSDEIQIYLKSNGTKLYDKIIGINATYIFVAFFIVLTLIYFMKKTQIKEIKFIFIFFLLPFLLIYIQKVTPGVRTWSYLIIPFVIGVGVILKNINQIIPIKKAALALLVTFIIGINVYIFSKSHPTAGIDRDYVTTNMSNFILNQNIKSIYIDQDTESYEEVSLRFYALRNKKKIAIFDRQSKIDLTKINYYLIENNNPTRNNKILLLGYKPIFKNTIISLFEKK